jgi:hypothetical protein
MGICGEYDFLDFRSSCIRESWAAIQPAAFVFVLVCCTYVPIPHVAGRLLETLGSPFKPFMILPEAEALGLMNMSAKTKRRENGRGELSF